MSNNLKLTLALVLTSLLLGGCTPGPDGFPPPLAIAVTEDGVSSA